MRTADDDPTLIRQKILRHAFKVKFNQFHEKYESMMVLKFSKIKFQAETEGNLINKAYQQTQPVNVMAPHKTLEDEEVEFNQPLWKRMKYTDDKKKGKVTIDEDKLV